MVNDIVNKMLLAIIKSNDTDSKLYLLEEISDKFCPDEFGYEFKQCGNGCESCWKAFIESDEYKSNVGAD